MAVSKTILRHLLGIKLAKIELMEPSGLVAKAIFSVSINGPRTEMRYFPYLPQAEMYFFERVRALEATDDDRGGMPDLLSMRSLALRRHGELR